MDDAETVYPAPTDPQAQINDPRDLNVLPPLGEGTKPDNWGKVNTFIDQHALKAVNFYSLPCDQADENLRVYEKGKSTAVQDRDVISNKIAKDIRAMLSDLLREPCTRTISPEENDEPPTMIPLMQPIQQGVDQMTGQPILQTAYPVNDQVEAEFEQKLIDYFWQKADLDADVESAMLNCRIAGWYTGLYEWDVQNMLPRLRTNLSVRQVLLDPSVGPFKAVETSNYAMHRWRVNWWQARAMYPGIARHIDAMAQDGAAIASDPIIPLGVNERNQTTGEKMIDLTFFFIRNYPAQKMTPEEALEWGEVEQREVANEQPGSSQLGNPGIPENEIGGAGDAQALSNDAAASTADGQSTIPAAPGDSAADAGQVGVPNPAGVLEPDQGGLGTNAVGPTAPRVAYFLPDSDKEVTPDDNAWPWWLGTRQIVRVDRGIAYDGVCRYWDLPYVHMPANPVPLSACGQGDPETMQKMQEGRNRALTAAVEHADLMAHPVQVYAKGAWDALPEKYKEDGASIAGMQVVVADDLYERLGGKISVINDAPPITASLGQILQILGLELEDQSPAPNATQGKQTGEVTGWQATQLLQTAAASRLDLPAKSLQRFVRRLVNLVRWSILWNVPLPRIQQICTSYPPEVVAFLVERGKQSDRNVQVDVNISSGGVQARKISEAVQKWQLQDPATGERVIGMETLRDRMGENNEDEQKKQGPILQAIAAARQAAQAQDQQKGKGGAPSGNGASNGNGHTPAMPSAGGNGRF